MRRRGRVRRVLKWAGAVACGALLVVCAVSDRVWACRTWELGRNGVLPRRCVNFVLRRGGVGIEVFRSHHGMNAGWTFGTAHEDATWVWWHRLERYRYQAGLGWKYEVDVPLWELWMLVLVPTLVLWYRDRQYPSWRCQQCGYDLTGNESGRCPECGGKTGAGG